MMSFPILLQSKIFAICGFHGTQGTHNTRILAIYEVKWGLFKLSILKVILRS